MEKRQMVDKAATPDKSQHAYVVFGAFPSETPNCVSKPLPGSAAIDDTLPGALAKGYKVVSTTLMGNGMALVIVSP
jgi:hypothetical protein